MARHLKRQVQPRTLIGPALNKMKKQHPDTQRLSGNEEGGNTPGYLPTILVLALISALGSMAIHILAPVLPLIQTDLAISVAAAQLVVGVYMGALGTGQLLAGPLVDRWGRMPMLYTGLLFYAAGSVGAVFSASLEVLLLSRLVQGLGGAAGLVSARVLVSDIFGHEAGARHQAALLSVVLVSPALAPTVGAFVAGVAGWRAVPAVLAILASTAMLFALRRLSRQAAAHRHPPGKPVSAISGFARLWLNRKFIASTGVLSFTSSALYIFLASAPFVFERIFGLNERMTGLAFLAVAVAGILGTRLTGWVDQRMDAMMAGCACSILGAGVMVILCILRIENAWQIVACMTLLGIGGGIAGPATINNAIAAEPGLAGTGASMLGATQMLVSGAATIPLGFLAPITTLELALAICLAASFATLSAISLRLGA